MKINQLHKKAKKKQLELLFERYGNSLALYGQNQWKIEEDIAWDLVYQTFYKVVDVLPNYQFSGESKFRSFIFKIYINYLKNRIRDDKTKLNNTRQVELNEALIAEKEEEKMKSSKIEMLKTLLGELEDWQRILLLMRAQGFAYAEIAKYTRKEEKNLKVYYGRLVKKLEKRMTAEPLKIGSNERK